MRPIRLALYSVWLGVLCLSVGLAIYVRVVITPRMKQQAAAHKQPIPVAATSTSELPSGDRGHEQRVRLAVPDWENGELRMIVKERTVASSLPPIHAALAQLVNEVPQFPRGTTVRSVKVDAGTASIDFSDRILSGMGNDEEQAVLMSLRKTAGQFRDIERIRLTADGKPIESLGGHTEIASTVPVER